MSGAFLAVDWGTTNRRAYLIEDGAVVRTERDDRGATAIPAGGFEPEVAALRTRFGELPMLLAGMVGSSIGWRQVAYVDAPAGLAALAGALDRVDERTAIVPGLAQRDPADVMRGEEVQLLGAAHARLVPAEALLCQPGTHCKWARLREGEILSFSTTMTGELFALLRKHSILAAQLSGRPENGAAFRAGVEAGAERGAVASLFGVRARGLLGIADDPASFVSGALIGADVARHVGEGRIHVLADAGFGELYLAAASALGGEAVLVDSHAAFVAGIVELRRLST